MSPSLVPELFVTGVLLGLTYAAAALGLSVTMGVLQIFNVTHGIVMVITGLLVWSFVGAGIPFVVAGIIAIVLAFFVGMGTDRLLRLSDAANNFGGLLSLFGLMIVMESAASMYWHSELRVLNVTWLDRVWDIGFMRISYSTLMASGLSLLGLIVLSLFLSRTMTGKAIRAIGRDRESAQVMGIPVNRLSSIVFGIGTALAAVGGIAIALSFSFAPSTHFRWMVWAILVVVLGGMGSIKGTFIAATVVGFLESFGGELIKFQYIQLLIYVLLVVVLLVRGEGITGKRARSV